jgi:hypothetical protein
MVIVSLPVEAVLLTVTFMVEVPAPVIDAGVNDTVTPLFGPKAVRAIAELKPPVTVVVIVELPDEPLLMVREVGAALIEKPEATVVTVSVTVAVALVLPEVPVTVTG